MFKEVSNYMIIILSLKLLQTSSNCSSTSGRCKRNKYNNTSFLKDKNIPNNVSVYENKKASPSPKTKCSVYRRRKGLQGGGERGREREVPW